MAHKYLFSGESCADGLFCFYGKSLESGGVYRWEPLATKLRGGEAAAFRRQAEARRQLLANYSATAGLLKVEGPVIYQGKTLLGWKAVPGESLFASSFWRLPLVERTQRIEPLIRSYRRYHALSLVVGPPDWKRIFWGEEGVFTPDPMLLTYLSSPLTNLPLGLTGCHPPESFTGEPLSQQGDLFFLGLLLYLCCTGQLPYPLENGWPTRALLRGEVIPPTVFSPELPSGLSALLVRLLSVAPEARPSAAEVEAYWERSTVKMALPLSPVHPAQPEKGERGRRGLKKIRALRIRWPGRLRKAVKVENRYGWNLGRKGRVVVVGLGGLLLLWGAMSLFPMKRGAPEATEVVAELLAQISAPTFPGTPFFTRAELWADLVAAKEERIAAAAQLLGEPVLEVTAVREVRRKPNWTQLEVSLVWHRWTGQQWRTYTTLEELVLERKGQRWAITARHGQKEKENEED